MTFPRNTLPRTFVHGKALHWFGSDQFGIFAPHTAICLARGTINANRYTATHECPTCKRVARLHEAMLIANQTPTWVRFKWGKQQHLLPIFYRPAVGEHSVSLCGQFGRVADPSETTRKCRHCQRLYELLTDD